MKRKPKNITVKGPNYSKNRRELATDFSLVVSYKRSIKIHGRVYTSTDPSSNIPNTVYRGYAELLISNRTTTKKGMPNTYNYTTAIVDVINLMLELGENARLGY